MKLSEIYTVIAEGNLLEKDVGYLTMIAIELLARVEGVPVAALALSAPRFALSYPACKRDLRGYWHSAPHYQAWRRLILDAQMRAAPGDVDGAPWCSLARFERLGTNKRSGTCYDLPKHLPPNMRPKDVSDCIVRETYSRLNELDQRRFRAAVNSFRRLFDFDLAQRSGLLPNTRPAAFTKMRDHRGHVKMSSEIEAARARLKGKNSVASLDYIYRLAFAGGLLNGIDDTLEDLRQAIVVLPNPEDVDIPPIHRATLHSYINSLTHGIGGRDYRLSESEQGWADLRKAARAAGYETSALFHLSKPASAQGLLPRDVSAAWLEGIISYHKLRNARSSQAHCRRGCAQFDALRGVLPSEILPAEAVGVHPAPRRKKKVPPPKDPVSLAWDRLYSEIKKTSRIAEEYRCLGYIRKAATKVGRAPDDITQNWLEELRDAAPTRHLHSIYRGADDLRKIGSFSHIQPVRKRRDRHGGLPEHLQQELEELLTEMGLAPTTYRKFKLSVGVLAECLDFGENVGLMDICGVDLEAVNWGSHQQQMKTYSSVIAQLQKYRDLPWTTNWKMLQGLVVKSGITISKSPVPKLLSWHPGPSPNVVSLEWAQTVDRDLRSTILNGPHGRADLAKTLARHVAAFDRLREIPEISASGLMPSPIGAIR